MIPAPSRRIQIALVAVAAVVLAILLLAATFPVAWLKGTAERRLASQFGSDARIGSLERESAFSFTPIIRAGNVHVAQVGWAGAGEMASIRLLRLRFHPLALLTGRFDADLLTARGVRLNLVRAADGRENWRKESERQARVSGGGMAAVTMEDTVIRYRDARQRRSFVLAVHIDPQAGFVARGNGDVDGAPVRLAARGGRMAADRPWPFEASIDGPALAMHARGQMAAPLDTGDMHFAMTARADDLKRIDRVIEAGLFGTQPVDLRADVRRRDTTWTIRALSGTIGQSRLEGQLTARKTNGRTQLDGEARFLQLNFEDLASDSGNAQAIALEKAQGLKIVPNTRVNIRKIDKTDGRLLVRVDRVIGGRRPSAITSLRAVLNLDNRILTVEPLRIGLRKGAIVGKAVVDQREGQPKPIVTLALDMKGSSISALAGGGDKDIDGRVDGHVRLKGVGDTIREAVGASSGNIGVVARAGSLPTRIAALIGFDIGKGLVGDDKGQSALRCAVLGLKLHDGLGTVDPLVIDTGISQSRGRGTIRFPAEAVALTLTGAPKGKAALRLAGPVKLGGTIREPDLIATKHGASVGGVLKAIGRAIAGKNGPSANDADCDALTRAALGG